MPLAATPPVSGPMKATLTLSLAAAGSDTKAKATDKPIEKAVADSPFFLIISFSLWWEPAPAICRQPA